MAVYVFNYYSICYFLLLVSLYPCAGRVPAFWCGQAPSLDLHLPIASLQHLEPTGKGNREFAHICTGAIIDSRAILTTASCLKDFRVFCHINDCVFRVVVGEYRQSLDFSWVDVHIHEYFDPNGNNNDIAIIRLKYSIVFSEHVQAIQLPHSTSAYNKTNGVTIGWTCTKVANRPIISGLKINYKRAEKACIRTGKAGTRTYGKLCGAERKRSFWRGKNFDIVEDTCKLDKGNLLISMDTTGANSYILGLLSVGDFVPCSKETKNWGIFTNVHEYLPWIDEKLGRKVSGKTEEKDSCSDDDVDMFSFKAVRCSLFEPLYAYIGGRKRRSL